jgi:hypothetical protein
MEWPLQIGKTNNISSFGGLSSAEFQNSKLSSETAQNSKLKTLNYCKGRCAAIASFTPGIERN